ncbi:MAG: hypothetical protein ACE5IY_02720 [bacterium]
MMTLQKSVRTILRECLNLQRGEHFVIVSHENLSEIAAAIWNTARRITKNLISIHYANKNTNCHELSASITTSLKHADACVILTPTHLGEQLFDQARQNGSRVIVLQHASLAMIERTFETNLNLASNLSRKLADLFSIGKTIELTSPSGTEAKIAIARIMGIAETGFARSAGELSSLPAGKASMMLNRNIEGRVTLDRIAGMKRKLHRPVLLNVTKGYITQIKGQREAEMLRKDIRKFGKNGRRICELGVGTNARVKFGNSAQEDEKCLGAIYLSLGQDQVTGVQGRIVHAIKGMVTNPTLTIDGRRIIEDGKILL